MFDLPLEYALIKFEDAKPSGKVVPELLDLAARGIGRRPRRDPSAAFPFVRLEWLPCLYLAPIRSTDSVRMFNNERHLRIMDVRYDGTTPKQTCW